MSKSMEKVNELVNSLTKKQPALCVSAKFVSGGKLSLEFAELLGIRPKDALSILNKNDKRFQEKPRSGWINVEPDAIKEFGIDIEKIEPVTIKDDNGNEKEIYPIGKFLKYVDEDTKEIYDFRLQIEETEFPDEWQQENAVTAAKQNLNGEYIVTKEGNYIFVNTSVELFPRGSVVEHKLITETKRVKVAPSELVEEGTELGKIKALVEN